MRLIAVWALVVALVACQPGQPRAQRSPAPRHSGAPTATPDPQRCARLAKLGFAQCPPMPDQVEVPKTTIKNLTNGAIDETTAQSWGRAFQQTEGYYRWAMKTNARDALTSGAFAEPKAAPALFGHDLEHLDQASSQGGVLVDQFETMTGANLVPIPANLQASMRADGFTPQSYGVAVEFTGPAMRSIRLSDGRTSVIATRTSTDKARFLVWGEFRVDHDLGAIWYEEGIYRCAEAVTGVCQI